MADAGGVMKIQQLTVLGCTGSIGRHTLEVLDKHPDRYRVYALCAHHQTERLFEQCRHFHPEVAVVATAELAGVLSQRLRAAGEKTEVAYGEDALCQAASANQVDTVMVAIVGAAGLTPAMAAVRSGKRVLLANKESLVIAGAVFMAEVTRSKATLLPVDSEHNAIFQCLPQGFRPGLVDSGVSRILLTASGGPLRHATQSELDKVTPERACSHPNWVMGKKISVDSATLMNKGLEVIEAHWLFGLPPSRLEVVVHPQSIVHSLVEYVDGSVLAELGNPDMRTPIAHALAWPERISSGVSPLDLFRLGRLDFEAPDRQRFPCLELAYEALHRGGNAPALLNAANEVAVDAFLGGALSFTGIPKLIQRTLDALPVEAVGCLEDVMVSDALARRRALSELESMSC